MREDWIECTLDDVVIRMTNGSSANQYKDKIGYPISRIETIWDEKIDLDRVKYIEEKDIELVEKYRLKHNDILLSHINSDNHLGKTAIFKSQVEVLIHGINLLLLRPTSLISADFLLFQLRFLKVQGKFIEVAQRAVNQSSINQRVLKTFKVSLPPLPEQRAIVAKIEALFSSLDSGIADLKKAQVQLKIYRQAVLKKAFEGGLTKEWRAKQTPLIADWKFVKFEKVFSEKPQNGIYKPSTHYGSGTKILRIDGFYEGVILGDYNYQRVRLEDSEIVKYSLSVGDIVVNRVNSMSHLGKCGLVKRLDEDVVFESNIMKINLNYDLVVSEYISHYLASYIGVSELVKNAKQAVNQASINQRDVSNAIIPLCSKEEQYQIVQEIESRLSVCDKVEESIVESLGKSKALRQSILKKAFEGRLLNEQELAACKSDPDYEPASVLLRRIKEEKVTGVKNSTVGRKIVKGKK
ncbi:restriction endonuclease subunit S [Flavobacterium sp. RSP29]|uniref:restriction endonuclease subunit S n=1 Tax=Flavobacterium sp. RSP29 TaxID=3401731 RepID=UPI003AAF2EF4